MYLGDVTWQEAGEYLDDESLALVPIGSTEQHGPHLPLSTDHVIAEGLARTAAEQGGYLCTPTITIGVSPHHRQFHGTMSVDPPAFRDYVESLSRSLVYQGIDRIVYVNAHGGNRNHLREVGRRLHADDVAFAVEWMWDESIPEFVDDLFETNGPHAGPKETSMVWHLIDNVRESELSAARDEGRPRLEDSDARQYGTRVNYDAIDNSPNGAFGDPTDASAAKGEQLLDAACKELLGLCDWIDSQPWSVLGPSDHVRERPGSDRAK
ncbi:MAG: creatininase family protein [Natronomonas sp.]